LKIAALLLRQVWHFVGVHSICTGTDVNQTLGSTKNLLLPVTLVILRYLSVPVSDTVLVPVHHKAKIIAVLQTTVCIPVLFYFSCSLFKIQNKFYNYWILLSHGALIFLREKKIEISIIRDTGYGIALKFPEFCLKTEFRGKVVGYRYGI